jgi:cytochrome c oxidase accessory protein FixG
MTMDNSSQKDKSDKLESEVYKKHEKVYPREVHGLFARLRVIGVLALLGIYYIIPWLTWGDRQAVLFDLPARKFYIFDWVFWPQDFIYLALLLAVAAFALFFFTAIAGRLWCGYACPQTVWTEAFLWIERKVEGSRQQQIKRDRAPWTVNKFKVKAIKHSLWILFSLFTGFIFVGYFTPVRELWAGLISFDLGVWEWFWLFFYGFATYGNAGWLREQVCMYMCPYARFQSAMFDKDTLVVAYNEKRGEPRGGRKKTVDPAEKGLGSCVDCSLCVQVCPTGIDIRKGLQYECIGCAACIDVCNDVMDKMGYERDLVRYTTEHRDMGQETHILRPRIVVYAVLLALITGTIFFKIATRIPLELDIIRDRNTLYRETTEGLVENVYTLKVINMDEQAHSYKLTVEGIEGLTHSLEGEVLEVKSGEVLDMSEKIVVDPVYLKTASSTVRFRLESIDKPELLVEQEGRFLGPVIR